MRRRTVAGWIAAVVLLSGISYTIGQAQQPVAAKRALLTGAQFRELPENEQRRYTEGLIDGMLLANVLAANKEIPPRIQACVDHKNDVDVNTILSRYLIEDPVAWQETASGGMFNALMARCPK